MTDLRQILKQYWGYDDFRGIQRDIIQSVVDGNDTLGLMPTGGGKSITFQVAALARGAGLCLVVTPLIALMKDQVAGLRRRGIMAAAIYAGMTRPEIAQTIDNAVYGAYRFLYVSPERLASSLFMSKVRGMDVNLLTVDEAHCISSWGYDFRPEYLRIAEVRESLPEGTPCLALTATATGRVIEDIQQQLHFREPRVLRMSFERKNLRYVVRRVKGDKFEQLLHILKRVDGSAIVYTRSRRRTREVAEALKAEGISATFYHAGLTSLEKDTRQRAWTTDRIRVMAATNAFGMGIDKPDVRIVLHIDVPDSVEAYFQEAGRAGRDGQTAWAVLLTDDRDAQKLRAHVTQSFPPREYIKKVYDDLAYFYQIGEGEAAGKTMEFNVERFCQTFRHYPTYLESALQLLTQAGYIRYAQEEENRSRVIFLVRRDDLYNIDYLNHSENKLLNAMMRQSGALFVDYVPIEEDRLGQACGMTAEQVYNHLRHLTQLRIINYIPQKNRPRITYTMRRVDSKYVNIPRALYEERQAVAQQRVDAMIGYFQRDEECRSRYLLHYFDDDAPPCGHCDVCLSQAGTHSVKSSEVEAACRQIIDALLSGKVRKIPDLVGAFSIPEAVLKQAYAQLIDSGTVRVEKATFAITLNKQ